MELLLFLILFPVLAGILMLLLKGDRFQGIWVKLAALVTGIASVYLLVSTFGKGTILYAITPRPLNGILFMLEIAIAIFILYLGLKYRNKLVVALILVQTALLVFYEGFCAELVESSHALFVDQFSVIMALIIGIIGSLICVYSVGYMRDYHTEHKNLPDRRNIFFFVMFLFLGAMFGVVFSNNLFWLFFFWEVTTLCSFLLIGYSGTEEARNNAFTALWMNLLGGVAFMGALIWLSLEPSGPGTIDLLQVMASGKAIILVPAVLIGFAGLTKAAQLPFSGWLVGAMVAPTPVSALLHSSTMVKAGVYILVRLSPVFQGTVSGMMIALVGSVTFLLASAIAISQNNAKKVLAYSTIANLGLIVACAGIGTAEAIWAAILLIIFHAVAKSLLFLGTGTIEHRIGNKDIEEMGGLIERMPKVTILMLIGMAGMFIAPFGMLISKWAALRAFIDAPLGLIFVIILAFGSALTVFFWTKWIGKIISVTSRKKNIEHNIPGTQWIALYAIAALTVLACFLFPVVSSTLIVPFVTATYGSATFLSADNILIMLIMLALILVMPVSLLYFKGKGKHTGPYLSGIPATPAQTYTGSAGTTREIALRNYYLTSWFGEREVLSYARPVAMILITIMFAGILLPGVIL
ncbi:MAG: proton-conducting transporter membrane subunit [Methanoregulaceae archaeon]